MYYDSHHTFGLVGDWQYGLSEKAQALESNRFVFEA